jgi:hypothetical protein
VQSASHGRDIKTSIIDDQDRTTLGSCITVNSLSLGFGNVGRFKRGVFAEQGTIMDLVLCGKFGLVVLTDCGAQQVDTDFAFPRH